LAVSSPHAVQVETVVKVGGGLLADIEILDAVLTVVAAAARLRRLLVVPGGGPFADAVRMVDKRIGLPDTAAHWMAVLAMDQHAQLIAARLAGAVLVADPREIGDACDAGRIPVLMPSGWLRESDPLPHSWDVTSDSIAAWVAGRVCARRLVLVKPPGVRRPDEAVDPYFARALSARVEAVMIAADQIDALRLALAAERQT
jgi:aspartokinase-like uncharacterized kinase